MLIYIAHELMQTVLQNRIIEEELDDSVGKNQHLAIKWFEIKEICIYKARAVTMMKNIMHSYTQSNQGRSVHPIWR